MPVYTTTKPYQHQGSGKGWHDRKQSEQQARASNLYSQDTSRLVITQSGQGQALLAKDITPLAITYSSADGTFNVNSGQLYIRATEDIAIAGQATQQTALARINVDWNFTEPATGNDSIDIGWSVGDHTFTTCWELTTASSTATPADATTTAAQRPRGYINHYLGRVVMSAGGATSYTAGDRDREWTEVRAGMPGGVSLAFSGLTVTLRNGYTYMNDANAKSVVLADDTDDQRVYLAGSYGDAPEDGSLVLSTAGQDWTFLLARVWAADGSVSRFDSYAATSWFPTVGLTQNHTISVGDVLKFKNGVLYEIA